MGLFGKLFSNSGVQSITFSSEKEAFFAIIYACITVDGDVSDEEINNLAAYCVNNSFLSSLSIVPTYKRMIELKQKVGLDALVSAALPKISPERKATLFAVAVDFMLADGVVGPKEESLLDDLQKGLGIVDEQATKIVEVLLIKNKN